MTAEYIVADVFDGLATIPDGSVDLVVTSPPFLALRSYLPADHPDKQKEIGSEPTPAAFTDVMLAVTAELRRVLAPHGSICVELGDTYSSADTGEVKVPSDKGKRYNNHNPELSQYGSATVTRVRGETTPGGAGWPLAKSLSLIPEAFRFALAYGINPHTGAESPAGKWRIRNVIRWVRPNPPVGALGDKWRPATSELVVATVSGKRFWDDLATRKPHRSDPALYSGNGYSKGSPEGIPGSESMPGNPSGAPLLDWWEIPPGGYQGAHYAVFPPELVEPCVKAMCPLKVCVVCGEPSRRITEVTPEYAEALADPTRGRNKATGGDPNVNPFGGTWPTNGDRRAAVTVGWTDCGHGSIVCKSCNALVPSDYAAIQRSRSSTPVQGGMGETEVLGEPVEGPNGQAEASADVRGLRRGLPGADGDSADLQPLLFGEAGAHGGPDAYASTSVASDGPARTHGTEWGDVHSSVGAGGVSGQTGERLDDGASGGDAGTSGSAFGSVGVGSPPERDQDGQPPREPGDSDSRETVGLGDVPELPAPLPGSLTGYVCPCGSNDFKYVADHWRPGRVLDPFAGSGTTLLVADALGYDTIGIDIDERNRELWEKRQDDRAFTLRRQAELF